MDVATVNIAGKTLSALEILRGHPREKDRKGAALDSVIDRVQGREADVVLFSVTRSNRDSELGFLSNNARINVALSRARDLLCIIGDAPFVRGGRDDVGLKRVLDYVNDHTASCCIDAPPL
jgi:hypothetical protein